MGESELFIEALAIDDPVERSAFLDRACAADAALRRRGEGLLRAHGRAAPVPQCPAPEQLAAAGATLSPGPPLLPAHVGRYRILGLLGEGGMGAVYEAEQDNPRRHVALKVIRPGLASPPLVRRFTHEA